MQRQAGACLQIEPRVRADVALAAAFVAAPRGQGTHAYSPGTQTGTLGWVLIGYSRGTHRAPWPLPRPSAVLLRSGGSVRLSALE